MCIPKDIFSCDVFINSRAANFHSSSSRYRARGEVDNGEKK